MNLYMKNCVNTMIINVHQFSQNVERAARQDDGAIDKNEQKILEKIQKLNKKYIEELNKL